MNKKLRTIFLIYLIATLTACMPSKLSKTPPLQLTQTSALTESDSVCELKLKSYIKNHSIHFVASKNLAAEADLANKTIIANADEKLELRQQMTQFIEYQHSSSLKKNGFSVERTTSLGLNTKDSFFLMYFETSLKTINDHEVKTFSQRYGVNSKNNTCSLELLKSSLISMTKTGDNTFRYNEFIISPDDEVLSNISKDFQIHKKQELIDFIEDVHEYNKLFEHPNIVKYIPDVGIAEMKIHPLGLLQLSTLGNKFKFKTVQSRLVLNNKDLLTFTLGFDETNEATYSNFLDTKSYSLPFSKYFEKVRLGEEFINFLTPNSNLDSDYQIHNSKLNLISSKKLSYLNLEAYWKILKEEFDQKTKLYKYSLQENPTPEVYSKTTIEDLKSNSTIESDLTEIRELADKIQQMYPDRKNRIKAILEYLAHNYSYDFEMVNKGTIRPLTTREALQRK
ncbi:MAG: hypothetical protein L6Q37_08610, partial [Bdellovibrionaceae bacterium]|nr:hypothetical protein [Pseudobdellovibrionaceae bacterium]